MAKPIPEDSIAQVKQAADIVSVVSDVVALKRSGKNYQGLCPFHSEKTPSFTVSPEKQMYYCFGCQNGGNVFRFLMEHEGLSFPEAVRKLAVRYGVPLPDRDLSPEEKRQRTEREALLQVNKEAAAFYRERLRRPAVGDRAMAYLRQRGYSDIIIDRFSLGYAPAGWDHLIRHLQRRRIPRNRMEKAGLVIPRKSGSGVYDRFRDRVIFPIHDTVGQVVAFGGRVLDDTMPKYLNSPETPIYRKRKVLYGAHLARTASRASGSVFVVEGYLDLMTLHQFGFENAVATLGTALTPDHVRILRGLVGEEGQVTLVYDSDDAGIKAARRSIAVFDRGFVDAHILVLPPGHDPDTFLNREGRQAFEKQVEKAQPMISFVIDSAVERHGATPKGKARIVREVQSVLASVQDRVERSLYTKELAERIGVRESDIVVEMRR
ncbi:MAG: DNA primase, partial [Desulfobacteraceae bacterium]|nr:DNA primase [Desulfobacteraceae bacterium]